MQKSPSALISSNSSGGELSLLIPPSKTEDFENHGAKSYAAVIHRSLARKCKDAAESSRQSSCEKESDSVRSTHS